MPTKEEAYNTIAQENYKKEYKDTQTRFDIINSFFEA
jgi:hypothetical protein